MITDNRDDIRNWNSDTRENPIIVPDEDEGERLVERPPNIPTPTLGQGIKNIRDRAKMLREKASAKKASGPVRKPRIAARPRVAVDRIISHAWTILGRVVAPVSMPVARVLEMQAPVAGMVLEDIVKNTVVDKILQPLARIEGGGEVAFALVGPPLLVGMLTRKPEMAPVLVPLLRESLRSWIEIAGPKLEKVAEQESKFREEYGVKIDMMIEYFLQDVTPPNGKSESGPTIAG